MSKSNTNQINIIFNNNELHKITPNQHEVIKEICPFCGGNLIEHCEQIEVKYRGHTALRPSLYSFCDDCGAFVATPRQTRANKADTMAFRRCVDFIV